MTRGAGVRTSSSSSQSSGIVSSGTASFSETTAFSETSPPRAEDSLESAFGLSADVAAPEGPGAFLAFFLAHLLAFPTRKPVISSTSSRKYSRTGCVKPRMNTLRTAVGTTPAAADAASGRAKYAAKKSASAVALISTTRKSLRSFSSRRNSNNSRSDSTLRSCTSSSTTCVTPRSAGSDMSRRSKMPIVQKCKRVLSLSSLLSNRTEYPTTSPHFSRRSAATRSARPMALMRRGCVHTMFVSAPRFSEMARSRMNWGTCVDLPQPVSPDRTTTGAADTAAVTSSREPLAGRFARLATIFAAEASAERAPPPFPFPPRVDPKYASCASFRRTFSFSMNSLEGARDRCAPRLLSRGRRRRRAARRGKAGGGGGRGGFFLPPTKPKRKLRRNRPELRTRRSEMPESL